jgi:ABC-type sugar transport system permease subunit
MKSNQGTEKILRAGKKGDSLAAMLFLSPNIIGFMVFTFIPIIASLFLAFCKWDVISGIAGIEWVGLKNFVKLLGFSYIENEAGIRELASNDLDFWKFLYNTIFLMSAIPIGMAGSLCLALLLNNKIPLRNLFRTIYFLPTMCVPVALFLMWRWLFNDQFGIINWGLGLAGVEGPDWLGTIKWAKPSIIISGLWMGIGGGGMILYLAGLQNIPKELYESAHIDGASAWKRFWHVTWPLLTPTTFFIFITSVIGGFQGGFEAAFMMTGGGPANSTMTLAYGIYQNAFLWFKMGYAAAISWVLFILVFIVTMINWKFGGRMVHYY